MDWREAARGIEPWEPCRLMWLGGHLPPGVRLYFGVADLNADMLARCVVDLSDPDTRAAFDRRLALRLGAPKGAVEEGVIFSPREPDVGGWRMLVGLLNTWDWWSVAVDTDDPLLARTLAWRSVA